jgi:adenosylcobinamide kinase/adenosylcobinamide-phosphate guanylyltransferase
MRGLVAWSSRHQGPLIVVTNEVGMGLIPPYRLGRVFRDALGRSNAVVASAAGRVYHLTAGLALELKALGARPIDAFGEAPRE